MLYATLLSGSLETFRFFGNVFLEKYVKLRYTTLRDWLFTAGVRYDNAATSGFRCLAVHKEPVQELYQKALIKIKYEPLN